MFIDAPARDDSGVRLAGQLRRLHERLPILLTSVDAVEELSDRFADDRCTSVIGKPYSGAKLAETLKDLVVLCRKK